MMDHISRTSRASSSTNPTRLPPQRPCLWRQSKGPRTESTEVRPALLLKHPTVRSSRESGPSVFDRIFTTFLHFWQNDGGQPAVGGAQRLRSDLQTTSAPAACVPAEGESSLASRNLFFYGGHSSGCVLSSIPWKPIFTAVLVVALSHAFVSFSRLPLQLRQKPSRPPSFTFSPPVFSNKTLQS